MSAPIEIAKIEPHYPCWLWNNNLKQWQHSMRLFFEPTYYRSEKKNYTHWIADTAEQAPTEAPPSLK